MTQRAKIEQLLINLHEKEVEFEAKMATAEIVFSENMRHGRADFARNMTKAREELEQTLRDLG